MFRFLFIGGMLVFVQSALANSDEPSIERLQTSGLNSSFTFKDKSFPEYLRLTRAMISKARVDLDGAGAEEIISGNAPFELVPSSTCPLKKSKTYRRGILLTHGLTDSPYFMRALAHFFQEQCFYVQVILLPGHGTRPGDLLEVKWQDWLEAERFGVDTLDRVADEVYLLGFSTGGSLSIYHSLHDKRIRGLFLFSPAIKISPLAALANFYETIGLLVPKFKWLDVMPDEDPYKYESFPANAAFQIYLLSTQLRAELTKPITIPTFVAVSEDDATVETPTTIEFFKKAIHPLSALVFYSTKKDAKVPNVSADKVEIVDSAVPQQRIISSAHTALVNPPDDPHYGVNRNYANCMHYYLKQELSYRQCKEHKESYLGEITTVNLKRGVIERLMYNPNFDSLKKSLMRFVDSLPTD